MLLNIQGINSTTKLTLFEQYINSMKISPSIIALCESWLDSVDLKRLNFKNYEFKAGFGRTKKSRGGVVLLVKRESGLKCKVVKTHSIEAVFETCSINVHVENRVLQIILLYRPSNAQNNSHLLDFFNSLEDLLASIIEQDKEIILLGDFNIDVLKSNHDSNQLNDILSVNQFSLLNEMVPTRSFNGSETLIYHIYSNFDSDFNIEVMPIQFSDHDAVYCRLDIQFRLPKDKSN
jgi:exonuclease III